MTCTISPFLQMRKLRLQEVKTGPRPQSSEKAEPGVLKNQWSGRCREQSSGSQRGRGWREGKMGKGNQLYGDGWQVLVGSTL